VGCSCNDSAPATPLQCLNAYETRLNGPLPASLLRISTHHLYPQHTPLRLPLGRHYTPLGLASLRRRSFQLRRRRDHHAAFAACSAADDRSCARPNDHVRESRHSNNMPASADTAFASTCLGAACPRRSPRQTPFTPVTANHAPLISERHRFTATTKHGGGRHAMGGRQCLLLPSWLLTPSWAALLPSPQKKGKGRHWLQHCHAISDAPSAPSYLCSAIARGIRAKLALARHFNASSRRFGTVQHATRRRIGIASGVHRHARGSATMVCWHAAHSLRAFHLFISRSKLCCLPPHAGAIKAPPTRMPVEGTTPASL